MSAGLWLTSCTLPSIHRDPGSEGAQSQPQMRSEQDAAASGESQSVPVDGGASDDTDAGSYDPLKDPENRGEDPATFASLLPQAHVFAEWPMPDTSPFAKAKPSYSVGEQVITDNVTKLRWQRVLDATYPECTAEYEYVGRKRGVGSGCTWEEAAAYCKSPELRARLGEGDWRLPTKIELESLLDTSRINAVDPLFDDFPIDLVWSGTPVMNPGAEALKLAWALDFMVGATMDSGRFKGGRVRCVASASDKGGAAPDYDLQLYTVGDRHTQLEWQRVTDDATRTWNEAQKYCAELDFGGEGWRLPSLKELLTLVKPAARTPAIDIKAFPLTKPERHWTATEFLDGRDAVYLVSFADGSSWATGSFADEHYVRCVR